MKNNYAKDDVTKLIQTKVIGKEIIFFEEITSTNDYLKENINNLEHGTVALAKSQTKGRGRRGNTWENDENSSIFMSILLKPNIKFESLLRISLVCSLSILEALREYDLNLQIKWPNDILINEKKVCGILTECVLSDIGENDLILGIGINVNNSEFKDYIKEKATSLHLEGVETTIPEVIAKVLEKIEKSYYTYLQYSFKFFINDYKKYCCNINKEVIIINGDNKQYGKILDVNNDGSLLFESLDGEIKNLLSNEISVRGLNGYI